MSAGLLLPWGGILWGLWVRASVLVLVFWPAGSVSAAVVVVPGPAVSGLVLLQADLHGDASLVLKALELLWVVQLQQQLGDGQGQASQGRTG